MTHIRLVTMPERRVYHSFRSRFLLLGGVLANRSAARELGTNGFSDAIKAPPKAGRLALELWDGCLAAEPLDPRGSELILHEYIRACGHAGRPVKAYKFIQAAVLRGRRLATSADPAFWFDCARVCSIQGDLLLSIQCLEQAKRCRFKDVEAARVSPDLHKVRQNRATAAKFQALFP